MTPSPTESMKSTPPRSNTMSTRPSPTRLTTAWRSRGAVANSSSPVTATTVQSPLGDTSSANSTAASLPDGSQEPIPTCTAVTTPTQPVHLSAPPTRRPNRPAVQDRHGPRLRHRSRLGHPPPGRDPRLVHLEELPPRPASFGQLVRPLPEALAARFGAQPLWSHQAAAIDLARAGRSVAIATGTASGKSLCYQIPIAEAAVAPIRPGTSLLLFPTKALAQDQLRAISGFDVPGLVAVTYDGDTGPSERTWARANANVVLTNPEMLHHGVLPHHQRWATFLMRLQYVVVDELHVLRGVFGTHVAHLLRRLRRLCAHYGSDPTFVFSSATIGQPGRLASQLCGKEVAEITDDGSPRGRRTFVLWNPAAELGTDAAHARAVLPTRRPRAARTRPGRRPSANRQTAAIMAELIGQGRRTIAFCRSRKGTELVAAEVRRRLPPELADRVRPYRGGYLTGERRLIESELFGGQLRGVVATTALELGIDVGGLDACVLDGFPGTIASMWQQAGRAGRQTQDAIVVLVAGDDQLDQWLMSHPDQVFARPPEPAVINPANPYVLNAHLACAAYERPLSHADERWWPERARRRGAGPGRRRPPQDPAAALRRPRRAAWPCGRPGDGPAMPWACATGRPTRCASPWPTARSSAPSITAAPGAWCTRVPSTSIRARPTGSPNSIWTTARPSSSPATAASGPSRAASPTSPSSTRNARRQVGASRLSLGAVQVTSQVVGYRRFDTSTGELLGTEELFLPPGELTTRAFWYTIEPEVLAEAGISPAALGGTLHAAEHAAIGLLPLFTICDRWDVGGVSTPFQLETGRPTIVIYDGYPGGAGIAELGYDNADRHLEATLEVIQSCPCDSGCPSCVQSPKCGNGNDPLDKAGAIAMLRAITTLIAPSS